MNVYDFDKTIYAGDSTIDFFLHCMKRYPAILLKLPKQVLAFVKYKMNAISKKQFKEEFFCFLQVVPDIDIEVSDFWDKNQHKIKQWYLTQKKDNDVIISASPDFLLRSICDRLYITNLIASEFDSKTGRLTGENCYGNEKVGRFRKIFGDQMIERFYSDSLSDKPMAEISREAFWVKGKQIERWK